MDCWLPADNYMWVRAQTNVFASFMLGILAISVYAYWHDHTATSQTHQERGK